MTIFYAYLSLGLLWFCLIAQREQRRAFPDCRWYHWVGTALFNILFWPLAWVLSRRLQ